MDYWEHREWWQQHENILRAFSSLERSATDNAKEVQNELRASNAKLSNIEAGINVISSQLDNFISFYAHDRALTAQLEAERFEFSLHWESLTIKERKDFLRARNELLAEEAEQNRLAELEWEAGAPERERNHQLIVEQNIEQSAIAAQRNKEYLARQREVLESVAKENDFNFIIKRAEITLWLAFLGAFLGWIGLSYSWANSFSGGSLIFALVFLLVPFIVILLISRLVIGFTFESRFTNAVKEDKRAAAFRKLNNLPNPTFTLKFPYRSKNRF